VRWQWRGVVPGCEAVPKGCFGLLQASFGEKMYFFHHAVTSGRK
jgi:hypothetical protein